MAVVVGFLLLKADQFCPRTANIKLFCKHIADVFVAVSVACPPAGPSASWENSAKPGGPKEFQ